ncbi:hypothetical protein ACFV5N_05560 [Streptomyces sp. NPDC059853]|uniref:hypothetical protein n=1 Tax=Streptomyces sp. NPDC059853 TaxID=3346973 RepID=UPI003652DFBC
MSTTVKRGWRRRAALTAAIATVAAATTMGAASASAASGQDRAPGTEQEIVAALTGLLPEGTEIAEAYGQGYLDSEYPFASVEAGDSTGGTTTVDVSVGRSVGDWTEWAGCPDDGGEDGAGEDGYVSDCTETELSDGRLLSVSTWEYETDGSGEDEDGEPFHAIGWDVWLEGPGSAEFDAETGRSVYMSQFKELTGSADADAYVPVLDEQQLTEAVQAPVWQELLAALDAEYGEPVEEEWEDSAQIPAAELRAAFRSLAPEGIEVTDAGNDADDINYAELLTDDGDGAALLSISAWGPWDTSGEDGFEDGVGFEDVAGSEDIESFDGSVGFDGEEGGVECVDSVLEGGAELSVCSAAPTDEDPVGLWWAAVYYPDGSGVDITQTNLADWEDAPVRADAPLTADQLAEIAADGVWADLIAQYTV